MKKRVVVAMSGGVDSSVTAALLKRQGFDVIGIFMKLWSPKEVSVENRCCNIDSLESFRKVATQLEIPHYTIDFSKEFKKYVYDYFIKEYSHFKTPNPCVICNKFIKFKFLLEKVLSLNADYLATGHYVRTHFDQKNKRSRLLIAKDSTKDQSYFLWTLTQKQLKHLLFPIGDYTKREVRALARKWRLPTAERAESQGLCFIGNWSNQEFLKKFIKPKVGQIVDLNGNILGKHRGLHFYTIGQRRGLEINVKSPNTTPLYVIAFDTKNNTLIVDEEKYLYKKELYAEEINWIRKPENLDKEFKCGSRIRYGHPMVKSQISNLTFEPQRGESAAEAESQNKIKVMLEKPIRAITPGQSVVFYDGEEVLGGGIIQ